jgi:hypothetical protein
VEGSGRSLIFSYVPVFGMERGGPVNGRHMNLDLNRRSPDKCDFGVP